MAKIKGIYLLLSFLLIVYGFKIIFTKEVGKGVVIPEDYLVLPYGLIFIAFGLYILFLAFKQ